MPKKQTSEFMNLAKRNKLISLAGMGIIFAIIFSLIFGRISIKPHNSLKTPPIAPYEHNISGLGIVEASSGNINLGAFMPGIVSEVLVAEGDIVKKGEALFRQDQRSAKSSLLIAKNKLEIAKKSLEIAKIEQIEQNDRYKRAKGLKATSNISEEIYSNRKFAMQKTEMDVLMRESQLKSAENNLELAQIALDKTSINAPINGIVLKVRIRPGEFISGNEQNNLSPMLIGTHNPLYLRVKIDENDLWRFDESLKAHAYLRSNQSINSSLSFVRIEPYATTKEQLRGSGIELIDTRIVNILYKIEDNLDQFFIGQQLDVFIESTDNP